MLEALDPAGDGFRYATTRIGQSSMIEDVYLDPQTLLGLIRQVDEVLGAAEMAFQAEAEGVRDAGTRIRLLSVLGTTQCARGRSS